MSEKSTIARPYAKALFEVALTDNTLREWSESLAQLALIISQPSMIAFLKHPRFLTQDRLGLIYELMPEITSKMKQALVVIAQAKRLLFIPEIASLFETFKTEREHVIHVRVTSATEIHDKAFIAKMKKALEERFGTEVVLEFKVDPSVLGGAIIQAGDVLINGSLSGRVAQLRNALGV